MAKKLKNQSSLFLVIKVPMLKKYHRNLPQYLHFLGLKYHGNLPQYSSSSPNANVMKLFTMVIYYHPMIITVVILFYNTERQQYHGTAVNYCRKRFCNIVLWLENEQELTQNYIYKLHFIWSFLHTLCQFYPGARYLTLQTGSQ
jgi:hypothetical protein